MKKLWIAFLLLISIAALSACYVEYPELGSGEVGEEVAEETNEFSFSEGFNFLFLADTKAALGTGDYSELNQLLTEACKESHQLKFVLHSGDVVNSGMDADGNELDEWPAYEEAAAPIGELPMRVSWGDSDDNGLLSHFEMLQNGPAGLTDHFYSFSYENVHFVFLDGAYMGLHREEYTEWLRNDIAVTGKDWNIVICHYPLYPAILDDASVDRSTVQRDVWESVYAELGIDLVLSGYQGVYARTYPMLGGTINETEGIPYVMANSGSALSEVPADADYLAVSANDSPSYCLFNVNGGTVTMMAYNLNGDLIDELILEK